MIVQAEQTMHDAREQEKSEILRQDPQAFTDVQDTESLCIPLQVLIWVSKKRAVVANMIVLLGY